MDSIFEIFEDALYRLYTHHVDLLGTLAQRTFTLFFRSDSSCFGFDLLEAVAQRTLFCVIVTLLAVCVIWTILGHMTVRADGVFIWSRDKHEQPCLLSHLRVFITFIFHLLISFLDSHSIAFEATLCFFSLTLDAPSIYPAGYSRTNTFKHVAPLSYSPRCCLRRLCRIDSVSPYPNVISSGEARSAPFVILDCGRPPRQGTFGPRAQV